MQMHRVDPNRWCVPWITFWEEREAAMKKRKEDETDLQYEIRMYQQVYARRHRSNPY